MRNRRSKRLPPRIRVAAAVSAAAALGAALFVSAAPLRESGPTFSPPSARFSDLQFFPLGSGLRLARPVESMWMRPVVDLRQFFAGQVLEEINSAGASGMSVVLCLRWADENRPRRRDRPPDPDEGERRIDDIIELLDSVPARNLARRGKLWVQFYDRIAVGPGRINLGAAGESFAWAEECARRIRESSPGVLISGPALAGLEALDPGASTPSPRERRRRELLMRAIRWSADHADAIDLHRDRPDRIPRRMDDLLGVIRNAEPRFDRILLVSWEGLPARPPAPELLETVHPTPVEARPERDERRRLYRDRRRDDFGRAPHYYPRPRPGDDYRYPPGARRDRQDYYYGYRDRPDDRGDRPRHDPWDDRPYRERYRDRRERDSERWDRR